MAGLREGWISLRNRLLMDRGFHRWAARFPLTRGVTRDRARALFDMGVGFVYTQIAIACVRLDLLTTLQGGPKLASTLAQHCALSDSAFERLARAAATLKLLEPLGDGRWALGTQGAALVGNPGLKEMIAHHSLLYADLADPVALLRGAPPGRLSAFWPYARGEAGEAASYSALMAATQPMIADQALAVLPLKRINTLLDVGGGEGAFLIAAAQAAPHLKVMLFDLPEVAARARARFAAAGLGDRAQAIGGDFRRDSLPRGADAISLVRVLHDHDDSDATLLLRRAHEALSPGGRLAIVEPLAGTRGAETSGDGYFGFYLLAMGSGRPRTPAEIAALARPVGWRRFTEAPTPLPLITRVLLARREIGLTGVQLN